MKTPICNITVFFFIFQNQRETLEGLFSMFEVPSKFNLWGEKGTFNYEGCRLQLFGRNGKYTHTFGRMIIWHWELFTANSFPTIRFCYIDLKILEKHNWGDIFRLRQDGNVRDYFWHTTTLAASIEIVLLFTVHFYSGQQREPETIASNDIQIKFSSSCCLQTIICLLLPDSPNKWS